MAVSRKIEPDVVQVVNQIVHLVHPKKVILFGSFAQGSQTDDSDLDFLIVVDDHCRPNQITDRLYSKIRHRLWPCDFVVTTATDLTQNANNPGLIYHSILEQGVELYAE
jgi:predicted nucleotidyltransferase